MLAWLQADVARAPALPLPPPTGTAAWQAQPSPDPRLADVLDKLRAAVADDTLSTTALVSPIPSEAATAAGNAPQNSLDVLLTALKLQECMDTSNQTVMHAIKRQVFEIIDAAKGPWGRARLTRTRLIDQAIRGLHGQ